MYTTNYKDFSLSLHYLFYESFESFLDGSKAGIYQIQLLATTPHQ